MSGGELTEKLFTPRYVGTLLRFKTTFIETQCKKGRIPGARKILGQWRIPESSLPLIHPDLAFRRIPGMKRQPRQSPTLTEARVYFIQRGDDGPIKIGVSTDVAKRLGELQCGSAEPLHLRAAMTATNTKPCPEEQGLHERFDDHRMMGEWFTPAPELLEFIASLNPEGE